MSIQHQEKEGLHGEAIKISGSEAKGSQAGSKTILAGVTSDEPVPCGKSDHSCSTAATTMIEAADNANGGVGMPIIIVAPRMDISAPRMDLLEVSKCVPLELMCMQV